MNEVGTRLFQPVSNLARGTTICLYDYSVSLSVPSAILACETELELQLDSSHKVLGKKHSSRNLQRGIWLMGDRRFVKEFGYEFEFQLFQ